MEPMTLASPTGSPSTNSYLPSFLMGEQQTPTTPRNNTMSPNKTGSRNISFGFGTSSSNNPVAGSPPDYNRSILVQKTLFGGYQQTPPPQMAPSSQLGFNVSGYTNQHVGVLSGPPTQGLFDSLRNERNQVHTPTRSSTPLTQFSTPVAVGQNLTRPLHITQQQMFVSGQFNESLMAGSNNTSCNISRIGIMSPMNNNNLNPGAQSSYGPSPRHPQFWITVYGFPPNAVSIILQHFSQCGSIIDKIFPPQNGNWLHIRYSSRLECDKALSYNEKILADNIMIGVTQCKDKSILDKENHCDNTVETTVKVRPLAQTAYKSVQNEISVSPTKVVAQKSSGIVNKALDLFFGW